MASRAGPAQPPVVGRSARARAGGFTLLEILLVLVLVAAAGILAAMVFTGGMDGMRLRSESKEIAAQLRYTRARAIATGQPQRFRIDPRAHAWEAAGERRGRIDGSLSVRFTGVREAQLRAGEGAVLFFPDGGSTGGRITLSAGKAAWSIDVGWLTGETRLLRDAVRTP